MNIKVDDGNRRRANAIEQYCFSFTSPTKSQVTLNRID